MIERKWTQKKTGVEKIGIYDDKVYYNTWYQKNKDKLVVKMKCDLCDGSYSISNYSNHSTTAKHLKAEANSVSNKN